MIKYVGSKMSKELYQFIAFNRANTSYYNNWKKAEGLIKLYEQIEDIIDVKSKEAEINIKVREWLEKNNKNADGKGFITDERISDIIYRAKVTYENQEFISDKGIDNVTAAAFTYWVTKGSFMGNTDPYDVSYRFNLNDGSEEHYTGESEKALIETAIKSGVKLVEKINHQMVRNNIIVENLDYKELIKKYNGKVWKGLDGKKHQPEESYKSKNKLWYMDPPYHPATLYDGLVAGYEESFNTEMVRELVRILHNDEEDTYGELFYFLKSDYSPKYNRNIYKQVIAETVEKINKEEAKGDKADKTLLSKLNNYKERYERQYDFCSTSKSYHDFDILEENDINSHSCKIECDDNDNPLKDENGNIIFKDKVEYYVDLLGNFSKGVSDSMSDTKKEGTEFLWCRGNYSVETAGVYNGGVLVEQKQEEQ